MCGYEVLTAAWGCAYRPRITGGTRMGARPRYCRLEQHVLRPHGREADVAKQLHRCRPVNGL